MKTPSPILSAEAVLALEEIEPRVLWREEDEPIGYVIDGNAWAVGWTGGQQVRFPMPVPHSLNTP